MDLRNSYARQVRLLLTALPHVAKESCFALKGGTAINLFVQDFPRLSVDIDLAYKTYVDRETDMIASSYSAIRTIILTGRCIAILKFNTYRLFAGSCVIWQC